jgi:hypothetical protein
MLQQTAEYLDGDDEVQVIVTTLEALGCQVEVAAAAELQAGRVTPLLPELYVRLGSGGGDRVLAVQLVSESDCFSNMVVNEQTVMGEIALVQRLLQAEGKAVLQLLLPKLPRDPDARRWRLHELVSQHLPLAPLPVVLAPDEEQGQDRQSAVATVGAA